MAFPVFDEQYTAYQLNRGWLRRLVRRLYLANVTRHCLGPALDFGCGVGELLARLPAGSLGLEINAATVEYCRRQGLTVRLYDGDADQYRLSDLPTGVFHSLIVSHVLEHLADPLAVLQRLMAAAHRLGIARVIVVVPGARGYASDPTHQTFVDEALLTRAELLSGGWRIRHQSRFPFNLRRAGDLFTHNELMVVYDRA